MIRSGRGCFVDDLKLFAHLFLDSIGHSIVLDNFIREPKLCSLCSVVLLIDHLQCCVAENYACSIVEFCFYTLIRNS